MGRQLVRFFPSSELRDGFLRHFPNRIRRGIDLRPKRKVAAAAAWLHAAIDVCAAAAAVDDAIGSRYAPKTEWNIVLLSL